MDNNYFDFLGQNSVAGNDNTNAGGNNDKGKVNLTVRVDADCQVVCDGDFLFLANANQIVKDKAPMGQHLMNFISLDYPEATVEKIVDFPIEGNNYLIVVNELREKVEIQQKEKESKKQAEQQAEEEERKRLEKKAEEETRREYEKTHDIDFSVNGVHFKMIYVKGGTFTMGDSSEDNNPKHSVTLRDYHIGETQVTQALWKAVMGNNPSHFKGDDLPVENVSWNDCLMFMEKLGQKTGKSFWLPTEAQWEYAARGGDKCKGYKYSGSDNEDDVAWYGDNSGDKTHLVKTKKANELGLYDMSGNVQEWCTDAYLKDYYSDAQTDPEGPDIEGVFTVLPPQRVMRGSSYKADTHRALSYRHAKESYVKSDKVGFRLAIINEEKIEKLMLNWKQGRDMELHGALVSCEIGDFDTALKIFEDLNCWLNDEYLNAYKSCRKDISERKEIISKLELADKLWKEAKESNWEIGELHTSKVCTVRLNKYEKIKVLLEKIQFRGNGIKDPSSDTFYKRDYFTKMLNESKRLIGVLENAIQENKVISVLQKAVKMMEEADETNWPERERYTNKVGYERLCKYISIKEILEKYLPLVDEKKIDIPVPLKDGFHYKRDYFNFILEESNRLVKVLGNCKPEFKI